MMDEYDKEHLPGLDKSPMAWAKALSVFAILILINVVAFMVSFGWGVIITLPLTLVMGFMLMRDLLPRHRLPSGRPNGRISP